MPVSCPSGCSFVEAGRQTEPLDFAYQARVHPNPFSSNLRTSPSPFVWAVAVSIF
jgi:hypothetical protein